MTHIDTEKLFNDFRKHYGGTLEENRTSLKDLINTLAVLIEAVGDAKVQIPSWKYHTQTLVGKIIFTSHSILSLSNGYEYGFYKRTEKTQITDHTSMFVLTRALIENYVTLCYIYNNSLSDEVKIFRFKLWEVSGLISRQNWGETTNEEIFKKKETERLLIEKILYEIQNIPEYQTLDKGELKKLKNHGLPRLYNWHKLIEMSELRNVMFSELYSFFSTYAHSEYLSILQLSQASFNSQQLANISNVQLSLSVVRMIISMSIDFYAKNFKTAEMVFDTFPIEIKNAVLVWKRVGREQ